MLHKISHQLEHRLVAISAEGIKGVVNSVVERECVALLVLEEDAGHMACGEGIVVAVASQFATVQSLEIVLFAVDFLKKCKAFVGISFNILHGIIFANAA